MKKLVVKYFRVPTWNRLATAGAGIEPAWIVRKLGK